MVVKINRRYSLVLEWLWHWIAFFFIRAAFKEATFVHCLRLGINPWSTILFTRKLLKIIWAGKSRPIILIWFIAITPAKHLYLFWAVIFKCFLISELDVQHFDVCYNVKICLWLKNEIAGKMKYRGKTLHHAMTHRHTITNHIIKTRRPATTGIFSAFPFW